MRTKSDAELLNEYSANKSEAAFGEIVRRYADAVYSAALRQVGNETQARDVAQIVFVDLARKAGSLGPNTVLIGWLHRAARLAALELLRKDQRRIQRERQAMEFHDPSPEADDWNAVRPALDEAIANLGDEDRHALLLRFFKNESLASVGTTLGVSEDAAQKRVSRALGKLREFLAERGINTTAAALSVTLAANAIQAAPVGLAASLTAGALTNAVIAGGSIVPLLKLLIYSNMKTAFLILTLAGGFAGITLVRVQSQHRLHEAQVLAAQQAEEIETLSAANEQLARQTNDLARLRDEARDVLRLRGEVTQLRRQTAEAQRIAALPTTHASTNQTRSEITQQVNISTKFFAVPVETASSIIGGSDGSLTESEFKSALESLEQLPGASLIGAPSVVSLCGRTAEVKIGSQIPLQNYGTENGISYTNLGIAVRLSTECSAKSDLVTLTFNAKLNDLLDLSAAKDGSLVVVDSRTISNKVSIATGRTLAVVGTFPVGGKWLESQTSSNDVENLPKSIVLFLTPTLIDSVGNVTHAKLEPN